MKTLKEVKEKYNEIKDIYEMIIDDLEKDPKNGLLEALCDEIDCPFNDEKICVAYSIDQQMGTKIDCILYRGY